MQVMTIQEALEFYIAGDHRCNLYMKVSLQVYYIVSLFPATHSLPPSKTGFIDL